VPIPDLDPSGLLPPGLHPCTLVEVAERFGRFNRTDRRVHLARKLEEYFGEIRATGMAAWIVVNGSFVTEKPDPEDIDLILVLPREHDLGAQLRPFEYNALSRRRVRKRHGFDVFVAREGSAEFAEYLAFFEQVKHQPGRRKGLLRVDA
jgi:uncharacterized protein DUF6932